MEFHESQNAIQEGCRDVLMVRLFAEAPLGIAPSRNRPLLVAVATALNLLLDRTVPASAEYRLLAP